MKPIHVHDSIQDYLAHPYISQSQLKRILVSPKHFLLSKTKDSDAKDFGRIVHGALLENKTYIVEPEFGDQRRTENKERRQAWLIEHINQETISLKHHEALEKIRSNIREHSEIQMLLEQKSVREKSIYYQYNDSALKHTFNFKARPDLFFDDTLTDLKTTKSITSHEFVREIRRYGYDFQTAFYSLALYHLGFDMRKHQILAIENEPPYTVALYTLGESIIRQGLLKLQEAMSRLDECYLTNYYPGPQKYEAEVLEYDFKS